MPPKTLMKKPAAAPPPPTAPARTASVRQQGKRKVEVIVEPAEEPEEPEDAEDEDEEGEEEGQEEDAVEDDDEVGRSARKSDGHSPLPKTVATVRWVNGSLVPPESIQVKHELVTSSPAGKGYVQSAPAAASLESTRSPFVVTSVEHGSSSRSPPVRSPAARSPAATAVAARSPEAAATVPATAAMLPPTSSPSAHGSGGSLLSVGGGGSGTKRPRTAGPSELKVRFAIEGEPAAQLNVGLVLMRRAGTLCDLTINAGSGAIPVHRVVLAACSSILAERVAETKELALSCTQEAADLVVRWIYGEIQEDRSYTPGNEATNEEVLRLSVEFGLLGLRELACSRLSRGLTASNVVHRVALCDQLRLPRLRAALVEALLQDKEALSTVSQDAEMLKHPALMGELLTALASGNR